VDAFTDRVAARMDRARERVSDFARSCLRCHERARELSCVRHFARHSYDAEPNAKRLGELAERVAVVVTEWRTSIDALGKTLESDAGAPPHRV